ncbi:MAG: Do family serine endopeptidase [Nitrospinaceae bacterium]|nr:Do family serine endopeptidase [Nitrospinaceae bacterium]NIR55969.1 Do family serine endopeptidase [Nitrospinaceae bacterium]NIS86412.1 Do family serine endopeptidase [Nitrospinaceae bacterium]NIT83250.1 Do family serine endopeptidase [Nitrospinaceae bacterium]NIU45457.1 Do family serine endopeptidase [Nitrospinaceae bacterium]
MKRIHKTLTSLLLAILLALPMIPGHQDSPVLSPGKALALSSDTNPVGTNLIVQVAKKQNPAVVWVESVKKAVPDKRRFRGNPFFKNFPGTPQPPQRGGGTGSGFIIDPEGYILTNHHVINGADKIQVRLQISNDEKKYEAELVGADKKTDIALLKIRRNNDGGEPFPFIRMGNSDQLEVGEWVIAIGNPFGLSHTVTTGIVSAKSRNIGAGPYDEFIQTDASINPGNSGGPLLNMKGEVVGINTAIISGNAGGNVGIGFAIPINMAAGIMKDLKEHGKVTRGWLGVMIQNLTPDLAESFSLKTTNGALVSQVYPDSPAFKGGLKRGDVIVEFAHHTVDDISNLTKLVATIQPGKTVDVTILRDGKKQMIRITVDAMEEQEA